MGGPTCSDGQEEWESFATEEFKKGRCSSLMGKREYLYVTPLASASYQLSDHFISERYIQPLNPDGNTR